MTSSPSARLPLLLLAGAAVMAATAGSLSRGLLDRGAIRAVAPLMAMASAVLVRVRVRAAAEVRAA